MQGVTSDDLHHHNPHRYLDVIHVFGMLKPPRRTRTAPLPTRYLFFKLVRCLDVNPPQIPSLISFSKAANRHSVAIGHGSIPPTQEPLQTRFACACSCSSSENQSSGLR